MDSVFEIRNRFRRAAGKAKRHRKLRLESLERRRLLVAVPAVSVNAPAEVMIGEPATIQVSFDNADPVDPGFGPFIDVYLPRNGADGVAGVGTDGISYVGGSANYLGAPVTTTVLVFPDDGGGTGSVTHPYAVDSAGAPLIVTGTTGDQLLVFELPFGSFTATQPAATITFETNVSNLADLATPLTLRARSGFRYGNDALDNPTALDPTLLSDVSANANTWTPSASITPTLVQLTKTYIGPENETATGPNFPRQYEIAVDIADGQTITDADIIDLLPNNIELVSVDTITPSGTTTNFPSPTPINAPNNDLVVNLPTVTGTTSTTDARIVFSYFVPFRDADGLEVLSPVSGDDVLSSNDASFTGDWAPIDARDPSGTDNAVSDPVGPEAIFDAKSIATQKSVALVNDVGGNGFSGGDTVAYTIQFQISDFFAFDDITLNDVLSDGLRFDTSFSPQLSVTEHGLVSSGNISPANFTVRDHFTGAAVPVAPIDGSQEINFDVSAELDLRAGGDRVVLGGQVPPLGTGGADPSGAVFDAGATTGTLVFRAVIQDDFSDDFPSLDASVDEGDRLDNDVTINGTVLNFADLSVEQTEADTSAAALSIAGGTLTKSIYAINGNTTLPSPLQLTPGSTITYRLQLSIPSSDVEDLALEDFLPLPVLTAGEVTTFVDVVDSATPAAGTAKFGPADTFRSIFGSVPAISTTASNSLRFTYGDFDVDPSVASNIDILFTVTANDEPFADGLFLTNQVRRTQDSTNDGSIVDDAIVQIQLAEPALSVTKGIVSTNNPAAVFSPTVVGPVAFSAPGSSGYRGGGTINSTNLASAPIDSDVSQIDAGDLVTFAIIVENTGSSHTGAFDVRLRDTLPTGFAVPGGGLNLRLTDGTGASMPFTTLGTGLFDPAGGVELTDPGATSAEPDGTAGGALDMFSLTSGENILVLTYDLEVTSSATPAQSIVNTATVFNYAGVEGGSDFTPTDLTEIATAVIDEVAVAKSVVATNQSSTSGSDVAIGEIVNYRSVITVPEGETDSLVWEDLPDSGLAIVDVTSVSSSSADVTSSAGAFATLGTAAVIAGDGSSVTLDFADVTNVNRDNSSAETITVEYRAVVLNQSGNDRGQSLSNRATVVWTGGSNTTSAPDVSIVEPTLQVSKNITPNTGQARDIFNVTLDLTHAPSSDADAFEIELTDALPAGFVFVPATLSNSSGLAPATLSESAGTITATWSSFPLGNSSQISFQIETEPNVIPATTITNDSTATWSGLPGDLTTPQSGNGLSVERTGDVADPGAAENDYRETNSDTVTIISPTLLKTLTATNQTHTSGTDVAIGEIVTYQVEIEIPRGSMPATSFVDTPDSGLAIVDVLGVAASPDISTTQLSFASIATNAVIASGGTSVTFDFGDLTNADATAGSDSITIDYRAVVLNTTANDRSDVLDNAGVITWNTSSTVTVDGPDITIVEPELSVTTSIVQATGQANDLVEVIITLDHVSGSDATAMDVSLENILPAGLNFDSGLTSSAGVAPATLAESSGTISATWPSLATTESSEIRFFATLDPSVEVGEVITNPVSIDWTSLPGDITAAQSSNSLSTERTGDTADPGAAANDHAATANDSITIIDPSAAKTFVSSNQTHTSGQDFAIGEIGTYEITLTLPQGVTPNAEVVDTPDAGLAIVDVVSITPNASVSTSITGGFAGVQANALIPADGSSLTLDFGDLTNADTNSAVAETVIIQYRAVVLNTTTNDRGDVLDNEAVFSWNTTDSQTLDGPDITIVEPELSVTTSIAQATGQANDLVEVIITLDHVAGSDATAMNVSLENILPAGLNFDSGLTSSAGVAPATLAESSGTISATWPSLVTTESSEIRFFATLDPSVEVGEVITNPVSIDWTSLPGDLTAAQSSNSLSTERTGDTADPGAAANDHAATASDSITIIDPSAAKTFVSSNQAHTSGQDFAIGEIGTYEITLTLPQGVTPNAEVIDTPDAGLAIVDVVSITPNASVSTDISGGFAGVQANAVIPADGSSLTLDFGDLTNADTNSAVAETVVIQYRAVVLNTTTNDRGDVLDNEAVFSWNTTDSQTLDGPDITIVEPELSVVVSNSVPATGDAGDTVQFTVTIEHTGASDADAFDVDLENLVNSIANHLDYVPGTMNVITSGGAILSSTDDTGGDLMANLSEFPSGATATMTFDAIILTSAPASTLLANNAEITWTSLPGDVMTAQSSHALSVERTGDTADVGAAANDHTSADSGTVLTAPPSSLKTVVSTDFAGTTTAEFDPTLEDLIVGEQVTFSITALLPEGSNTLVVTDQLPTGAGVLEVVSATVEFVGGQLTVGAPAITISDTGADAIDDRVVFDFGNVINTPDGVSNPDDTIEVRVVARVSDVPANVNSTVLTNTASIDVSGTISTSMADVEVVEPVLSLAKSGSVGSGAPGTTVSYSVTVSHDGSSTADAFDLIVADLLNDPNLDLIPGTVATDRGTITSGNGATDTTIGLSLASLARSESINITFDAIVNPSAAASTVIDNTATLNYDNVPGTGGRPATDSDQETFTTTPPEINLAITKTDSVDPTVTLSALTYTLTVTNNGPSTATNVFVSDNLPAGVTGISANASQGSVSVAGLLVSGNLGSLLPGQSATVTIDVTTPSTDGIIVNNANVTASETETDASDNSVSEPTTILSTSTISGTSWVDVSSDGVIDTGEILLPGVLITLTGVDDLGNIISLSQTTDANGEYSFTALRPGNYQVAQVQPTLFVDNSEYVGTGGGTQPANDQIEIALPAGVNLTGYDFTELGLIPSAFGKRHFLNSSQNSSGDIARDVFFSTIGTSGNGDLDGDSDVDDDDFAIFLTRLGEAWVF